MASTLNTRATVLNYGSVFVGAYEGGKMRALGENETLELSVSEKTVALQDHQNAGGGTLNEVRRIEKIQVKLKLRDFRPENLAMALLGDDADVAAGSITDESHTAYRGGYLPLAHADPSNVSITNGATPLVAGTDYQVKNAGIVILDTAVNVDDEETILVDYDYGAQSVVQALTDSGGEVRLAFDGANEAESGKPVSLDLYRVRFGPAASINMISDDFGALEMTGTVLRDDTKTGAGESKYFNLKFGA